MVLQEALLLVLLIDAGASKIIEVPAVVTVPEATPEQVVATTPTLPVWDGPPDTVGILIGKTSLWESDVRENGFSITLGVAPGNYFRDPATMHGTSNSLHNPTAGLYLKVESSLASVVFPESYGGMLHASQPRPFDVFKSTKDCPTAEPCRIDIVFPKARRYKIPQGDEHLTITLGPMLLHSGTTPSGPFMITINDDAQRDDLQQTLADVLEVVAVSSVLFGASNTAVMSSSRHLLLLHMKCGVTHDALDLATNPAQYSIGTGPNRHYLGGLISNLLLAFVPVLVHLSLVFVQWQCKGLERDEAGMKRAKLSENRNEMKCCGGVTLTEFRQLQETVRYPHYSLLFVLFGYQAIATCSWRLIITGSPSERAFGVVTLLFINLSGIVFVWWKLGKWDYRRMGAVYIHAGPQTRRREYFLGKGEWVSSTKRRLVQTYGLLFESYAATRSRFILIELTAIVVVSFLGVIDISGWNACIIQFSVMSVLQTVFLAACLWFRPWASKFDNHALNLAAFIQLLAMVLYSISFGLRDSSNGVYHGASFLMVLGTIVLIVKAFADILCLIFDTCSGRRANLQEAFEQGQTLFQGRQYYKKYFGCSIDPDDKEGEELIATLAPKAASTYLKHYMPAPDVPVEKEPLIERDPFDHEHDCLVENGFMLLSRKGASLPECPACSLRSHSSALQHQQQQSQPPSVKITKRVGFTDSPDHNPGDQAVNTIGDWCEYLTDEGASYYHNNLTNETSWSPPYDISDRYEP